jgi:hypothetical protein
MKKFYIPILALLFVLNTFVTQAQPPVTYNSITDGNPSGFTLDDGNFWQGGVAPPNPCTNCIINIYSTVSMVQNGQSSVPTYNCGGCTFLNDVVLNGSTVNLYGNTNLNINTYLQLFGSTIFLGNNPTSTENIFVNDQVDLDPTSSVQLANNLTSVNTNNDIGNIIIGPHTDFGHPTDKSAGLYYVPGGIIGAPPYTYSMVLTAEGYGTAAGGANFNSTGYTLNCGGASPNVCALGIVYGPVVTQISAQFGEIFVQSTTLPVQLVQFLALKNGDGSVKLSWSTSQEVNAGYYDVERSGDQSSWTKIGTVKATGNTSTTSNYSFVDKLPLDGAGYYRLKMVDLDGKFKYSKTVTVTVANDSRPLVVYNNPFSDMIRLKVNVNRTQTLVMTVTDMLGKTYINQNYHAEAGDNLVNLTSSISSHGVYVLHIHGDSYDQTVKLQKQ